MAKKHNPKATGIDNESDKKNPQEAEKNLSNIANKKLQESLQEFSKIDVKRREEKFGDKEFLEQFWEFFKEKHPNLLDEINSQEQLTIYVQNLEKKGFSLGNIINNTKALHEEFKETNDEKTEIKNSLKDLQKYCEDGENKMPANIFNDFANEISLKTSPLTITKATKLSKIGNLHSTRKKFLENKSIDLKEYQKSESEKILCPNFLPTERLLISASIKKIKKDLPDALIPDFEADFPTPVDIHSPFETLHKFKEQRTLFLDGHKAQIDETLAKKLDKIIISNGDIYKELQYEGEDIEWTKGFSEQTKNFRRMFNKLATRQIFEESKETGTYMEHHFTTVANEFKTFPPYLNEVFNIYKYNHESVIEKQPTHKAAYQEQSKILEAKENELKDQNLSEEQKTELHKKILEIKETINTIKRKAYADFIKTQNPEIGNTINNLVDNKFDMSKISKEDQQRLVDILVNSKLEDSIKNQTPNILGIDPNEYQKFIKGLFDLDQQDIEIKTQYGNIPIHFLEKSFLGGPSQESMEINSSGNLISDKKNLPLNFKIEITEQNKDFFENNVIFANLFSSFNSKNSGPIKLNDSYKVRVKDKNGNTVVGYLSEYPPSEEIRKSIYEDKTLKEGRFLYSHPITRPEDAREVMTRDGKPEGEPVVITKDEEINYDLDIVSKEINLNEEGIGALLFSHSLGQYNIKNDLSKEQENELAEKFGEIENIYKDSSENHENEKPENTENETTKEKLEDIDKKNKKEFLDERQTIKGHQETEDGKKEEEKTFGFNVGAKLLIRGPESDFLPSGSYSYMTGKITNIDEKKGTFKLQMKGNEKSLGKYEGNEVELPMTRAGIQKVKDVFQNNLYKLPDQKTTDDINGTIAELSNKIIQDIDPDVSFKGVNRDGQNFITNIGKNINEKVTHFGFVESIPGESKQEGYMYKIEHEPNKKGFKLTANDQENTSIHLNYVNFVAFVSSRKLQPQTESSAKDVEIPEDTKSGEAKTPKKRNTYSIGSIIGLVKNFGKKIGDGLKKYEDGQIEDLTDNVFYHGKFFYKLANIMPTAKMREAFENAGHEYRTERDKKVFSKIEAYLKFYETDPDFRSETSWEKQVKPYLTGDKEFKDNHQAAAMLVATIKKGKGPYSNNTDRAGKGMRVKILFGENHQKRYLAMKEKLENQLQQEKGIHGQIWADDIQNEILKLEMKYMVHCIDGRELCDRKDVPRLEGMYSKDFACKLLETESNTFFNDTVSSSTKEKGYSFELARFEFFRLLGDRPQQAIPCLKQMAMKATSPAQFEAIENAILTGMLSGVFNNVTQEDKKVIQRISRSYGFLPGVLIRDINHNQKIEKIIEMATGSMPNGYNSKNFSFGKIKDMDQIKNFCGSFPKRLLSDGEVLNPKTGKKEKKSNLKIISDFVGMKGTNSQGKKLIDLLHDEKTPKDQKTLLKEIEDRSLEKNENLEQDLNANGKILEQNILVKNQSHINELISFEEGDFKGKDEDERENKSEAWREIAKAIPKGKLDNRNEVIYFIKKFMNRFENKGFNTQEKKFLIRTLLTVNENKNNPSSDEMLRYVTVGNIVKSSGHGTPPDELISGLEAMKDFFKSNLETIINPDVIQGGFGNNFLEELEKGPYKIAPWDEFIDIKINKQYKISGTKEENIIREQKKTQYTNEEKYINEKIYDIAEDLKRKTDVGNKLKKYHDPDTKKTTKTQLHEVLNPKDIKTKKSSRNADIQRILSKDRKTELSDEEIRIGDDGDDD